MILLLGLYFSLMVSKVTVGVLPGTTSTLNQMNLGCFLSKCLLSIETLPPYLYQNMDMAFFSIALPLLGGLTF